MNTTSRPTVRIMSILGAWSALVLVLSALDAFSTPPDRPPLAMGAAIVVPVVTVLILLATSTSFRAWASALDPLLLVRLQSLRVIGFAFLALYSVQALPGGFAIPAGWGDVLVGVTAIPLAGLLSRGHGRGWFYAWSVVGVADLAVATALGVLHSSSPIGILAGEVPTDAVAVFPTVLIPAFLVPLAIIWHVLALYRLKGRPVTM